MGQPIEDDGPVIRRIGGNVSEDAEPEARCTAGRGGAACPSCAADPAPWYTPRWHCPRCGHLKRTRLLWVVGERMCHGCAEQQEREDWIDRRAASYRVLTPVERAHGYWQEGWISMFDVTVRGLTEQEREELYARSSRMLRLHMDRLEHPAGRGL